MILVCLLVSACNRVDDKKTGANRQVTLDVRNKIISFPDSILLLQSYYLSCPYLENEEDASLYTIIEKMYWT